MILTKIQIRNLLAIKDFVSTDLKKFNQIEGNNGVGKSAILEAIQIVLGTGRLGPGKIMVGEDQAEITIEIDDNISIGRTITAKGDTRKLVVDGQAKTTPVAFIKDILGPCTLDPTEFFDADKRARRKMLLSAIDFKITQPELEEATGADADLIDLSAFDYEVHGLVLLDMVKSKVYDLRAEENVGLTRLIKSIEQDKLEIPETFDVEKFKDFDISMKMDKLDDAKNKIALHIQGVNTLDKLRDDSELIIKQTADTENKIQQLKDTISEYESHLETCVKARAEVKVEGEALKAKMAGYAEPDTTALRAEIDEYNASRQLVMKIDQIKAREESLVADSKRHEALDDLYKDLVDRVQVELMSKVDMPIKGLAIDGDNITLDGKMIDNLSTSEQLRFGIDVARSLAKEFKVVLADRWESLSPSNQRIFADMAKGDGFQYLFTTVSDGPLSMRSEGEIETE